MQEGLKACHQDNKKAKSFLYNLAFLLPVTAV